MSHIDIARAWKDEDYRNSLSSADLAMLPENPAGMIELSDTELGRAVGGMNEASLSTLQCCTLVTHRCDTPCQWASCQ